MTIDRSRRWSTRGILALFSFLLACGAPNISPSPSVELTQDRHALLVTSANSATPYHFTLQSLPTESTLVPGLSYRPERFDLVQVSPDGRYVALSTAGHHTLIGLLDLATLAVREIDVVTEGDVVAFHWAADGRTLAYDFIPAGGYRRVKGYDVESGKGLVVPRTDRQSAIHVTFEKWGANPREVVLSVTDAGSNERHADTVTLIPRK